MKIDITARHPRVSDRERQYAEDKVGKLEKIYDRITGVSVLIDEEKSTTYRVELIAGVGGGTTLVAEERNADIFSSIDLAVDKMQRQLRKHKEKLRDRHRKGRE